MDEENQENPQNFHEMELDDRILKVTYKLYIINTIFEFSFVGCG